MSTPMSMTTTEKKKNLSSFSNHLLYRCAQTLDTSVDSLVEDFEVGWKFDTGDYSKRLVEFCSSKALSIISCNIHDNIADALFSRFTFDMMLAWEKPSIGDENLSSQTEVVAKEKEDNKMPFVGVQGQEQENVSLFYSDLMPLLVNNEPSVGEDAFVWLGSLVPLVVDVANGRFTFETLTVDTTNRLYFPGYDFFLKEIDKLIKYLQNLPTPNGVVLADDEFILHMEGTSKTQRVVRHIGGTSWPGRLTLTNYALYFEASGVINYEDALKMDLSEKTDHTVKRTSTGPWGAPIFDKALVYESSQLSDSVVLEFPEMTSSTRREHWLSLVKEIILMHQFLSKSKVSPLQAWEMQARTILAILRLHAAREMKRISPPAPTSFLVFSLFDELPKGDYVLKELENTLKQVNSTHPCSASSILKSFNITKYSSSSAEFKEEVKESPTAHPENLSSLETVANQAKEEAKEVDIAMATVEGLKEEGLSDSFMVLMELLSPLNKVVPMFQQILSWERPAVTLLVLSMTLIITYKEWIRIAIAVLLIWGVQKIYQARLQKIKDRYNEIVVYTGSDQSMVESIVSAQHGLQSVQATVQTANISILRIYSILLSKTPKHTDMVMMAMIGLAIFLAVVPLKIVIMISTLYVFMKNALQQWMKKGNDDSRGDRRLKEWWNSIPAIPVRTVDKTP